MKSDIVLQALAAASLVLALGLGYQGYQAAEKLKEARQSITVLENTVENLVTELDLVQQHTNQDTSNQQAKLKEQQRVINKLQRKVASLSSSLNQARLQVKKYRADYLSEKRAVKVAKKQMDVQLAEQLEALAEENEKRLKSQRSELEEEFAQDTQKAATQKRLDELMTKFASLKVDLDVVNKCDKGYIERYGQAKSVLSHMRTYIQQYDLSDDYYHFVISNDAQIVRKNRELCLD